MGMGRNWWVGGWMDGDDVRLLIAFPKRNGLLAN